MHINMNAAIEGLFFLVSTKAKKSTADCLCCSR